MTQEELEPAEKISPDPLFVKERKMFILPLQILKKDVNQNQLTIIKTYFEENIDNYLFFIQTISANIDSLKVENIKEVMNFYKVNSPNKPTKENKRLFIKKALDDNYAYWMKYLPEKKKEFLERYSIPKTQSIIVEKTDLTLEKLVEQEVLVAQTILREDSIQFRIYDTLSFDNLVLIQEPIPKDFYTQSNRKTMEKFVKELMQKATSKLKGQELIEVVIEKKPEEEVTIFIDNKLVQTPSIFLQRGEHSIFFTQKGEIIQRGSIKVGEKISKINASIESIKGKNYKIDIFTNPSNAALFLDEQFIGYSPKVIDIPTGNYYIRASLMGYDHINYPFTVSILDPIKSINLDFKIYNDAFKERLNMVSDLKSASFFMSIFSAILTIVSYEQYMFYQERASKNDNPIFSKRANQFNIMMITFGGISGVFLISTIVSQIFEYDMREQGFGIDSDSGLGVKYRF